MITLKDAVHTEDVISSFSKLGESLSRNLSKGLESALTDMASIAKVQHRYKVRTGKLYSATQAAVKELKGDLFINDTVAHYGVYVHEGHGTWKPDKFIYKAVLDNEPDLTKAINKSIETALREVGLK